MLRMNLFTRRDLNACLDDPFGTPPEVPELGQLALALPGFGQPVAPAAGATSTRNQPSATPLPL